MIGEVKAQWPDPLLQVQEILQLCYLAAKVRKFVRLQ
jgi:hypothetical protein